MLQQRALFPSVKEQDKRDQEERTAVSADTEFEVIFETYYTRIFKYIRFRVDCDYTAEDLTSQVFEKVLTRYGTFRADRSPFEAWLIAIARNTVNDYYRKQQRRKWFSLDLFKESPSREQGPEDRTLVREAETEMSRALQTLKPQERHLIALKFGAGLKNVQIAEFIGLSESHIGVMLFRATKKLKLELEREDKDGQPRTIPPF
ncbi:RNA polymerase sigma factor SigX [compost metagenome]|jgi:RNA polymerase sigma-70 factor (TIGR02952 family)|uniref:Sigma-70 family RNA polymerase sigma factor n=1 Tax=Paenibacillus rhizolycopersici TaxID=2780073 RepID=A0ABS2H1L8_9BACL|nr:MULTISPECIES: sigma-70 family RNA polymerase sigma factor [Paenibacillus]MBM6994623.1 sigma-70 family RNA polymerase sigma factor [Paenibacillus rhizolycopersici]MUG87790.1 sigma-70 family RNA polymerase sigma factor [Paenibacillus timonensis]GIP50711.1 specialized sigma subunit of RNA polymerase [Paenibacillus sp. J53TS2]